MPTQAPLTCLLSLLMQTSPAHLRLNSLSPLISLLFLYFNRLFFNSFRLTAKLSQNAYTFIPASRSIPHHKYFALLICFGFDLVYLERLHLIESLLLRVPPGSAWGLRGARYQAWASYMQSIPSSLLSCCSIPIEVHCL